MAEMSGGGTQMDISVQWESDHGFDDIGWRERRAGGWTVMGARGTSGGGGGGTIGHRCAIDVSCSIIYHHQ